MAEFAVVGAGFSGAVVARGLAEAGHTCRVFDARPHVAGNCFTEREAGVMVHRYGPHIFHTGRERVWEYLHRFTEFGPYVHRVKATTDAGVFSLPVNLLTINQFFGRRFSPEEAAAFLAAQGESNGAEPANFEEQALALVGRQLYEAFFRGYTTKQWGRDPVDLPASVLKRLPVRFTYDDDYFDHPHQGIPMDGYTTVVERILDVPGVVVELETPVSADDLEGFAHSFWSGPLDSYFGHRLGHLPYRTLRFERIETDGDVQGCAQMNYCSEHVPYTRTTEHKHFAPWERHDRTVVYREFSEEWQPGDEPYYPIRLAQEIDLLHGYVELARATPGVTFMGRLGTYRYIDMDVTIDEALTTVEVTIDSLGRGEPPPPFVVDPLAT